MADESAAAPEKPAPKIKLTAEEKKERRAEKKRLAALKRIEKQKQLIKLELQREVKYTAISADRGSADWENMLCNIKLTEFREDLTATIAGLEETIDRKANYVERMKENRRQAFDQFNRSVQGQSDFIDHSMRFLKLFSKTMRDLYEDDVDRILTKFHKETTYRSRINMRRKTYYENLVHATNLITQHKINQSESIFLINKEDTTNQHIERREKLRDAVVLKMTKVFDQMNLVVNTIRDTSMTSDKLKYYAQLVAREDSDTATFEHIRQRQMKLEHESHSLQEELIDLECKVAEKMTNFHQERAYFSHCFSTLKKKYDDDMKKDREALRLLVDRTHKTEEILKKHIQKGEHILAIAQICRKLQTEKEKVMPWPEDVDCINPNIRTHFTDTLDDLSHLAQMDLFWYKVSLADSQNHAINEEKCKLERDNENLRYAIRQYCHRQSYTKAIGSLHISPFRTVVIPTQEASNMSQINPYDMSGLK